MNEDCYRFPTDQEMVLALCHALELDPEDLRDGRHARRVNHIIQMIHCYHRRARATGEQTGLVKRTAIAAALWPDVHSNQDMKRKSIMRRWEAIAEAAGLLRVKDARGERGLRWQLLTDWRLYAAAQRGCGSVGLTSGLPCEVRRRPENRRQRAANRVAPWRRRVGNRGRAHPGSVPRLCFFPIPKSHPSGLGRSPLRGTSPSCGLDAHEKGCLLNFLIDAPAAGGGASRRAALNCEKRRIEEWGWGWDQAEAALRKTGGGQDGPLADRRELIGWLARFELAAGELAAMNGWPEGSDRALGLLLSLIGDEGRHRRRRGLPPVRHLGYFTRPVARHARRTESRVRARRPAFARRQRALEAIATVERLRDPVWGGRG